MKYRYVIAVIVAIAVAISVLWAMIPRADDQIILNLRRHVASNVSIVPMRAIVDLNYEEVCLQTPYSQKDYYEKETGHKVEGGYSVTDDTSLVWWLYGGGGVKSIRITTKELPFRLTPGGKLCYNVDTSVIAFDRSSPKVSYSIKEN